jgi:teichuronic acid biosynthesis glycosyltransferase TuaC
MTISSSQASTGSASAPPMHVLTLTPFYPSASDDATGCFVAEPVRALADLGVRSTILAVRPFYRERVAPAQSAPAHWIRYPALPGGLGLSSAGMFLFARILRQVRKINESEPVNLIHAHAPLPCGHAAALLSRELGIPFVVTVHGLDAFSTNQVQGVPGRWCKRVSQMVYRAASRVICVSEKVRQAVLEEAAGPVHTSVIYNGVDPELFSPAEGADSSAVILSVGNLIPIKGHELLLRAFAAIHQDFPEALWEIIGDGPEQARLSALAASLGVADKVRFRGRRGRKEVADAMRRSTLFALPSRYEGLGCVYLEAMAAGKPVIACMGQGIQEIIRPGLNGCLVSPGDLSALTGTLATLIGNADICQQIGRGARQTILSGFTLAHQAVRLVESYRECIA